MVGSIILMAGSAGGTLVYYFADRKEITARGPNTRPGPNTMPGQPPQPTGPAIRGFAPIISPTQQGLGLLGTF